MSCNSGFPRFYILHLVFGILSQQLLYISDIDAIAAQKKSVFDRLGSSSTDPKIADESHSSSDSPVKVWHMLFYNSH